MFSLEFDTGNAAFDDGDHCGEIKTILDRIVRNVQAGFSGGKVYDSNGNRIGKWTFSLPEREEE